MQLSAFIGKTEALQIPLLVDGAPYVPGDTDDIIFTVKNSAVDDADAAAIIQKVLNAGIEMEDHVANVTLADVDTDGESPRMLDWDIMVNTGTTEFVARHGKFQLIQPVTRDNQTSIPVAIVDPPLRYEDQIFIYN